MQRSRRRAASCRAVVSAAHVCAYACEPLERRVLLSNDPVIVYIWALLKRSNVNLDNIEEIVEV